MEQSCSGMVPRIDSTDGRDGIWLGSAKVIRWSPLASKTVQLDAWRNPATDQLLPQGGRRGLQPDPYGIRMERVVEFLEYT